MRRCCRGARRCRTSSCRSRSAAARAARAARYAARAARAGRPEGLGAAPIRTSSRAACASACRSRARWLSGPQPPADGRAVRRARRDHARPPERGAAPRLAGDRHDDPVRHPFRSTRRPSSASRCCCWRPTRAGCASIVPVDAAAPTATLAMRETPEFVALAGELRARAGDLLMARPRRRHAGAASTRPLDDAEAAPRRDARSAAAAGAAACCRRWASSG